MDRHDPASDQPGRPPRAATVVVVDDYEANVRLLQRVLGRQPEISVLVESDGRRGLDLIRDRVPDLVLLDLGLPTMDGEAVLRALRQEATTAPIPVVVLSGDAMPATTQRLHEMGATAYFAKPYDVPSLLDTVNELLSGGRSRG